jgi:hypothetical protein
MRKTLLTAILAAIPFAASAADLPMSYTYVEAGYTHLKIDSEDLGEPKGDGGYVRGSIAIAPQAYVFGGWSQVSKTYTYGDFDGMGNDLKDKFTISQPEIGIGYHMPFTDALDFVADLSYQRLEGKIKETFAGESNTYKDHLGIVRVNAGVRGKPSAHTEAWLKAGYFDGSDVDYVFDSQFVGVAGMQVNITPRWGIVGEVQVYDGATQASLGVRASF